MTTEVLRNMLYAGSPALAGLGYVVMDEVHYLADRFRGAVWEEVIIHLPESVTLVSLSATVSNAEEFGDWLVTVRGDTRVVVSEHRPVPLWQHVLVGSRMYDLFAAAGRARRRAGSTPRGAVHPRARRAVVDRELVRVRPRAGAARRGGERPPAGRARLAAAPPAPRPRSDVVEQLDRAGLLPAIIFVFSRAGCDAAVRSACTPGCG